MPTEKPKGRIRNLTVEFISLVNAGANKREVVFKNAAPNHDGEKVSKQVRIQKLDEEKRLVYGIVYAPDEVDAHGHTMTAEEIEKASHGFLGAGKTNRVDKQHDGNPDKGLIVESGLIKGEHTMFPDEPEGAWFVVIKVEDDETWKEVKDGELKGISLEGFAEIEELQEKNVDGLTKSINEIKNFLRKKFGMESQVEGLKDFTEVLKAINEQGFEAVQIKKDFESSLASEELRQATMALDSANWNVIHDDEVDDKKAALVENANQFLSYLDGLTVSKSSTTNGDEMPEAEETKKTAEEEAENKNENEVLKAIEGLKEDVNKKIDGLSERLNTVEKSAGVSKAKDSQEGGEHTKKEYNPKAPISFLG